MTSSVDDIARRSAQRLAPEVGPSLPVLVEARLQAGDTPPERFDAGTMIALAALLVNVAKFAWDIHRDCKKENKMPPSSEALTREIRIGVHLDASINEQQRDKIVSVVLSEIKNEN